MPPPPSAHTPQTQVALNEYRDVEVSTSSGEDDGDGGQGSGGAYFSVRFSEPAQEEEPVRG